MNLTWIWAHTGTPDVTQQIDVALSFKMPAICVYTVWYNYSRHTSVKYLSWKDIAWL